MERTSYYLAQICGTIQYAAHKVNSIISGGDIICMRQSLIPMDRLPRKREEFVNLWLSRQKLEGRVK